MSATGARFCFLFFYEVSCSAGRRGIWGNFENGREGNRKGSGMGRMVLLSRSFFFFAEVEV